MLTGPCLLRQLIFTMTGSNLCDFSAATLTGNKKRLLWLCPLPPARIEVLGEGDADQFP
jgi:hypothetical protein